jgi:putative autotransporter adhesin-like protein
MRSINLLVVLVTIVLIGLTSCNFNCIEPKGEIITENRLIETCSKIDIEIPSNVELVIGHEPNISITACESYLNEISTSVRRNKLIISGNVCNAITNDIRIILTLPEFSEIEISGSADVFSDSPLKSDFIDLNISGSGDINLNLFSNEVDCNINGSGTILLTGTCQKLKTEINGSGNFRGLGLNAYKADVKINGSGNASVQALNKLNAKVNGSGEIQYSGDPEIKIGISGSGRVYKSD